MSVGTIQIPVLFDMSGDSVVYGEDATGADFVDSHLQFLLDMTTEANGISLNASDISSAILEADQDTGDNIFFDGDSNGIGIDNLCNRIAKSITRGKLVHIPSMGNFSNSGIPVGGEKYLYNNLGQIQDPGTYTLKYTTSIAPIGDEQMLGQAMARVASVHLIGDPLGSEAFQDATSIQTSLETASTQTFNQGQTNFYNSLAVQLSKVLGGSKSSASVNPGILVGSEKYSSDYNLTATDQNYNNDGRMNGSILTGQVYTASSIFDTTYYAWKAFDTHVDTGWLSLNGSFDTVTGEYKGSSLANGITGVNTNSNVWSGIWIKIDLGQTVVLSEYKIHPRSGTSHTPMSPREGYFLSSVDGINWYELHHLDLAEGATGQALYHDGTNQLSIDTDLTGVNNREGRYFAFVVKKNFSSHYVSIGELQLFGVTKAEFDGGSPPTAYDVASINSTLHKAPNSDNRVITAVNQYSTNYKPFEAFNNVFGSTAATGDAWISYSNTFSNGEVATSYQNQQIGSGLPCEWIQVDLSQNINPGKFYLNSSTNAYPVEGYLLSSKDGNNWDIVHTIDSNNSNTHGTDRQHYLLDISGTPTGVDDIKIARHWRLAITKINPTNTGYVTLWDFNLHGIVHPTDFGSTPIITNEVYTFNRTGYDFTSTDRSTDNTHYQEKEISNQRYTASSQWNNSSHTAWTAFKNDMTSSWRSTSLYRYHTTTGLHDFSTWTGPYRGEWIQVDLSENFVASSYVIEGNRKTNNDVYNSPKKGYLLGSTDNKRWNLIHTFDLQSNDANEYYTANDGNKVVVNHLDKTSSCLGRYFRFVTEKLFPGCDGYVALYNFRIFGVKESETTLGNGSSVKTFVDDYTPTVSPHNLTLHSGGNTTHLAQNAPEPFPQSRFTASSWESQYPGYHPDKAFWQQSGDTYGWRSEDHYNVSSGLYQGANLTGTYPGEWIQVDLSDNIFVDSYNLAGYYDTTESYHNSSPKKGYLLSSLDGKKWRLAHTFDIAGDDADYTMDPSNNRGTINHKITNNENAIGKSWRFVVEKLFPGSQSYAAIMNLALIGVKYPSETIQGEVAETTQDNSTYTLDVSPYPLTTYTISEYYPSIGLTDNRYTASSYNSTSNKPEYAFRTYKTGTWTSYGQKYNTGNGTYYGPYITDGYKGEWLQVDLSENVFGDSYTISGYFHTTDSYHNSSPKKGYLLSSLDGKKWRLAHTFDVAGDHADYTYNTTDGYGFINHKITNNKNAIGRYWRFVVEKTFAGQAYCSIAQFVIYGGKETESTIGDGNSNTQLKLYSTPNSAVDFTNGWIESASYTNDMLPMNVQNQTFTASSWESSSYEPKEAFARCIDAYGYNYWRCFGSIYNATNGTYYGTTRTGDYPGEWIQVDLSENYFADNYVIAGELNNSETNHNTAPKKGYLLSSLDGKKWRLAHTFDVAGDHADYTVDPSNNWGYISHNITNNSNAIGRYWRFVIERVFPNNAKDASIANFTINGVKQTEIVEGNIVVDNSQNNVIYKLNVTPYDLFNDFSELSGQVYRASTHGTTDMNNYGVEKIFNDHSQSWYSMNQYSTVTGLYYGKKYTGSYHGEWVQVDLSENVFAGSYVIQGYRHTTDSYHNSSPKKGYLLSSLDGKDWRLAHTFDVAGDQGDYTYNTTDGYGYISHDISGNSNAIGRYWRFVTEKVFGTNSHYVSIYQFSVLGVKYPSETVEGELVIDVSNNNSNYTLNATPYDLFNDFSELSGQVYRASTHGSTDMNNYGVEKIFNDHSHSWYSKSKYDTTTGNYYGYHHTGPYHGEWVQVDLSENVFAGSYIIQGYRHTTYSYHNSSPKKGYLLSSLDGKDWRLAHTFDVAGDEADYTYNTTDGYGFINHKITNNKNAIGRYWRFVTEKVFPVNEGYVRIYQFSVLGVKHPSETTFNNLAIDPSLNITNVLPANMNTIYDLVSSSSTLTGQVYSASYDSNSNYPPSEAFDGITNSGENYWVSTSKYDTTSGNYYGYHHTGSYHGEWLQVDLSENVIIGEYEIYPPYHSSSSYYHMAAKKSYLLSSLDGKKWNLVHTHDVNSFVGSYGTYQGKVSYKLMGQNCKGRYFRIVIEKTFGASPARIGELVIKGIKESESTITSQSLANSYNTFTNATTPYNIYTRTICHTVEPYLISSEKTTLNAVDVSSPASTLTNQTYTASLGTPGKAFDNNDATLWDISGNFKHNIFEALHTNEPNFTGWTLDPSAGLLLSFSENVQSGTTPVDKIDFSILDNTQPNSKILSTDISNGKVLLEIAKTFNYNDSVAEYDLASMNSTLMTHIDDQNRENFYTASSYYDSNYKPYEAFDASTTATNENNWISSNGSYANQSPVNNITTTVDGNDLVGEWVQVEISEPVVVQTFKYTPRPTTLDSIQEAILAISPDGTSWTQIGSISRSVDEFQSTVQETYSTTSYSSGKYVRLICLKNWTSSAVTVGELTLLGQKESEAIPIIITSHNNLKLTYTKNASKDKNIIGATNNVAVNTFSAMGGTLLNRGLYFTDSLATNEPNFTSSQVVGGKLEYTFSENIQAGSGGLDITDFQLIDNSGITIDISNNGTSINGGKLVIGTYSETINDIDYKLIYNKNQDSTKNIIGATNSVAVNNFIIDNDYLVTRGITSNIGMYNSTTTTTLADTSTYAGEWIQLDIGENVFLDSQVITIPTGYTQLKTYLLLSSLDGSTWTKLYEVVDSIETLGFQAKKGRHVRLIINKIGSDVGFPSLSEFKINGTIIKLEGQTYSASLNNSDANTVFNNSITTSWNTNSSYNYNGMDAVATNEATYSSVGIHTDASGNGKIELTFSADLSSNYLKASDFTVTETDYSATIPILTDISGGKLLIEKQANVVGSIFYEDFDDQSYIGDVITADVVQGGIVNTHSFHPHETRREVQMVNGASVGFNHCNYHTITELNGKYYVSASAASIDELDPVNNTLTRITTGGSRNYAGHALFTHNGLLYTYGGDYNPNTTDDNQLDSYNPSTDTWTINISTSGPAPRFYESGYAIDDNTFYVSGGGKSSYTSKLDLTTMTWTTIDTTAGNTRITPHFVYNNRLYRYGSHTSYEGRSGDLTYLDLADPGSGWTTITINDPNNLRASRNSGFSGSRRGTKGVAVKDGKMYYVGGWDEYFDNANFGYYTDILHYIDLATNTVHEIQSGMLWPERRARHQHFFIGNYLYLFAGGTLSDYHYTNGQVTTYYKNIYKLDITKTSTQYGYRLQGAIGADYAPLKWWRKTDQTLLALSFWYKMGTGSTIFDSYNSTDGNAEYSGGDGQKDWLYKNAGKLRLRTRHPANIERWYQNGIVCTTPPASDYHGTDGHTSMTVGEWHHVYIEFKTPNDRIQFFARKLSVPDNGDDGSIDELRFYNTSVSEAHILEMVQGWNGMYPGASFDKTDYLIEYKKNSSSVSHIYDVNNTSVPINDFILRNGSLISRGTNFGHYSGSTTTTLADNSTSTGEYIEVNMGQQTYITSYELHVPPSNSHPDDNLYPKSWILLGSTDGSSWVKIHEISDYTAWTTNSQYNFGYKVSYMNEIENITAQYYRLIINKTYGKNGYTSVAELLINGVKHTSETSGITQTKSASLGTAANAFDGSISTVWDTSSSAGYGTLASTVTNEPIFSSGTINGSSQIELTFDTNIDISGSFNNITNLSITNSAFTPQSYNASIDTGKLLLTYSPEQLAGLDTIFFENFNDQTTTDPLGDVGSIVAGGQDGQGYALQRNTSNQNHTGVCWEQTTIAENIKTIAFWYIIDETDLTGQWNNLMWLYHNTSYTYVLRFASDNHLGQGTSHGGHQVEKYYVDGVLCDGANLVTSYDTDITLSGNAIEESSFQGTWRHIVLEFQNPLNDPNETNSAVSKIRWLTENSGGFSLKSRIDDIRFYDQALTQAQVTTLATGMPGTFSGSLSDYNIQYTKTNNGNLVNASHTSVGVNSFALIAGTITNRGDDGIGEYTGSTSTTLPDSSTYNGEWIQIDVGQTILMTNISLVVPNKTNYSNPKSWKLLISQDNTNWVEALDVSGNTIWDSGFGSASSDYSGFQVGSGLINNYIGRYFKIIVNSVIGPSNHVKINEVVIKGVSHTLETQSVGGDQPILYTATESSNTTSQNTVVTSTTHNADDTTTTTVTETTVDISANTVTTTTTKETATTVVTGVSQPTVSASNNTTSTTDSTVTSTTHNADDTTTTTVTETTVDIATNTVTTTTTKTTVTTLVTGVTLNTATPSSVTTVDSDTTALTTTYNNNDTSVRTVVNKTVDISANTDTTTNLNTIITTTVTGFSVSSQSGSDFNPNKVYDASGVAVPALKSIYEQLMNVPGRAQIMQSRDFTSSPMPSVSTITGGFPFIPGDKLVMYIRPKIQFAQATFPEQFTTLTGFGGVTFGEPVVDTALASGGAITGQTYTESSKYSDTYAGSKLFDGSTTTFWITASDTYNSSTGVAEGGSTTIHADDGGGSYVGHYVQIEFANSVAIEDIKITPRNLGGGGAGEPKDFRILSSSDGSTFRVAYSVTEGTLNDDWSLWSTQTFHLSNLRDASSKGKYWRIAVNKITTGNKVQLAKVELIGNLTSSLIDNDVGQPVTTGGGGYPDLDSQIYHEDFEDNSYEGSTKTATIVNMTGHTGESTNVLYTQASTSYKWIQQEPENAIHTFSFWYKHEAGGSNRYIFDMREHNHNCVAIVENSGVYSAFDHGGARDLTLYINGVESASATYTATEWNHLCLTLSVNFTAPIYWGHAGAGYVNGTQWMLDGYIDDVRFFNEVLAASQISDLAGGGNGGGSVDPYDVASSNSTLSGQTYTGSSLYNNQHAISGAFNGVTAENAGSWVSSSTAYSAGTHNTSESTAGYDGEWIQVDIGQTVVAKEFTFYTRNVTNRDDNDAKKMRLFSSNDGTNWTQVYDWTNLTTLDWRVSAAGAPKALTINQTATGRYFRLAINELMGSVSYTQIAEFEIKGITEAEYNANQALANGDPITTTYPTSTLTNGYPTTGSILDISGLETNITKLSSTFPALFPGNTTGGNEAEPEKFGWVGSANANTLSLETTDETDTRTMDLHIWKITITL